MISTSIYLILPSYIGKLEAGFSKLPKSKVAFQGMENTEGWFYAIPSEENIPTWFAELDTYLTQKNQSIKIINQSAGGIVTIMHLGHFFALCFGTGWLKINDDWIDPEFGRRVALNAIPPDKVVELKAEQVFAKRHVAKERAPSASNRKSFGIDYDRDFLGAVEGIPSNTKKLGGKISGATSLRLRANLDEISEALNEIVNLNKSKDYLNYWPEVDNIVQVVDEKTIESLEENLDEEVKKDKWSENLMLVNSIKQREDSEVSDMFVIGRLPRKGDRSSRAAAPYIMLGNWDYWLKKIKESRSIASAKSTKVHGLNKKDESIAQTTIYNCFSFETNLQDSIQYILSDGRWFKANQDYIKTVNDRLDSLSKTSPTICLPKWNFADHEGIFNKEAAKQKNLILFDAKNVQHGGGKSKFEFCDLMDIDNKTLYFVKVANNSSHMSHLSEQVRRTVELFFGQDPSFRKTLASVVMKHYPSINTSWTDSRPSNGSWKLCIVPLGKDLKKLPFFAKCGLYRLIKEMDAAGHELICDQK